MQLENAIVIRIKTSGFDLDKIAQSGHCFRWVEIGPSKYLVIDGRRQALLEKIEPSISGVSSVSGVKISCADMPGHPAHWFRYLDLQTDYSAMRAAIPWQDAPTTEAADIANGVRLLRPNLWETIITLVISQGMSVEKTRATVTRMCAALGDLCGGPFGVYRAFPGPEVLRNATERLKSLGLGYRARYVSNIARLVLEGEICLDYLHTADYTEARTYLKSIDGIGERIASLICLYNDSRRITRGRTARDIRFYNGRICKRRPRRGHDLRPARETEHSAKNRGGARYAPVYYGALTAFSLVGTAIAEALGGWDGALKALVCIMAVDYITGVVCALIWHKSPKSADGTFESKASIKGLFRKGAILLVVLVAYKVDLLAGTAGVTRTAVILFFCANDGMSIVENLGIMGVPMPPALKDAFAVLRQKSGDEESAADETE